MTYNNFLKAVYAQLTGVFKYESFNSRIYYYEAPPEAAFPYVVFDVINETNYIDFASDGRRYLVRVWIYTDDDSAITVNDYTDLVVGECNYNGTNYSASDNVLVCSRLVDRVSDKYNNKWIKILTFEYLVQED